MIASRTTSRCAAIAALALLIAPAHAQPEPPGPPNPVDISPRLQTAGQPSAQWLTGLAERGIEAVINLVPPTTPDRVEEEAVIVGRQGLVYVNIPVDFANPTARDVEHFLGAMTVLAERRVLVHCQVNMRASVMTFLYRTIVEGEDPATAYAAIDRVWVPNPVWKRLIETELARHGIDFEPM